ncbi:MAG: LptF/LptG family permease [Planctomycetota bacterium]|jgi:lipopolysaccharide export LptBFGC system permease protein LptF
MLFTLHRYIFRELLRVFVLAVVALTLILSLGSILQPVQEYGVGPRQVVHLMGYFLPITLTFVLPMAALFAGALVYGRFAGDNELDACRASGISVLTLVFPGLTLAIIVAIANLLLSFYVMPVFVHSAEKSLKADAKQILFRNIQRRRYYELPPDGQYLIYADQANLQNDTLSGVIVAEMKGYEIQKIRTAEAARVNFNPSDRFNEVQIIAYKPSQMGEEGGGGAEWGSLTAEFGSLLGDDIKFKKIDEMREIQADLMRFYPIAKLARETYAQLTMELLAQDIENRIAGIPKGDEIPSEMADDANSFYELLGEPNSVKFFAGQCSTQDEAVNLSGEVVVIEYDTDSKRPLHTLECEKASLHIEGDKLAPTVTMDIHNAKEAGSVELMMRHIIRGLLPPEVVEVMANEFKTEGGSLKIEKLASGLSKLPGLEPSPRLAKLQSQLQRTIRKTFVEIKAEIHSRLVFGTGCIPMILIGIGLGIIKKGGHLLSAFGASCVPAAVLIVCIMSGKQVTENLSSQTVSGVAIMWVGLGFLSLLTVVIYSRLLKN